MPVAGSGSDIRRQATEAVKARRRERARRIREAAAETERRRRAALRQRAYAPPTQRAPGQGRPSSARRRHHLEEASQPPIDPVETFMRQRFVLGPEYEREALRFYQGRYLGADQGPSYERLRNALLATERGRLAQSEFEDVRDSLFSLDAEAIADQVISERVAREELEKAMAFNQPGFQIQRLSDLKTLGQTPKGSMGGLETPDLYTPRDYWRLTEWEKELMRLRQHPTPEPAIDPKSTTGKLIESGELTPEQQEWLESRQNAPVPEITPEQAEERRIELLGADPLSRGPWVSRATADALSVIYGIPAGWYGGFRSAVESGGNVSGAAPTVAGAIGAMEPVIDYAGENVRGIWDIATHPSLDRPVTTGLTYLGLAAGAAGAASRVGAGYRVARPGMHPDPEINRRMTPREQAALVAYGRANPDLLDAPPGLGTSLASILLRGPAPKPRYGRRDLTPDEKALVQAHIDARAEAEALLAPEAEAPAAPAPAPPVVPQRPTEAPVTAEVPPEVAALPESFRPSPELQEIADRPLRPLKAEREARRPPHVPEVQAMLGLGKGPPISMQHESGPGWEGMVMYDQNGDPAGILAYAPGQGNAPPSVIMSVTPEQQKFGTMPQALWDAGRNAGIPFDEALRSGHVPDYVRTMYRVSGGAPKPAPVVWSRLGTGRFQGSAANVPIIHIRPVHEWGEPRAPRVEGETVYPTRKTTGYAVTIGGQDVGTFPTIPQAKAAAAVEASSLAEGAITRGAESVRPTPEAPAETPVRGKYLYVEAPDGTVLKRRTDNDYSHAVVVKVESGAWETYSFHRRHDLAAKQRSKLGSRYPAGGIAIVPTRFDDPSKAAPAPAAPEAPPPISTNEEYASRVEANYMELREGGAPEGRETLAQARLKAEEELAAQFAPPEGVRVIAVPPKFYEDHIARDLPEEGHSRQVGKKGGRILVEMDEAAYNDLLSDARHYSDPGIAREMGNLGLASSARATVKALEAQAPPTRAPEAPTPTPEEPLPTPKLPSTRKRSSEPPQGSPGRLAWLNAQLQAAEESIATQLFSKGSKEQALRNQPRNQRKQRGSRKPDPSVLEEAMPLAQAYIDEMLAQPDPSPEVQRLIDMYEERSRLNSTERATADKWLEAMGGETEPLFATPSMGSLGPEGPIRPVEEPPESLPNEVKTEAEAEGGYEDAPLVPPERSPDVGRPVQPVLDPTPNEPAVAPPPGLPPLPPGLELTPEGGMPSQRKIQIGNYSRNLLIQLMQQGTERFPGFGPGHLDRITRKAAASQAHMDMLAEGVPEEEIPDDILEAEAEPLDQLSEEALANIAEADAAVAERNRRGLPHLPREIGEDINRLWSGGTIYSGLRNTFIGVPNEIFRAGMLMFNPAYARNIPGNLAISMMESPAYWPAALGRAVGGDIFRGMSPEARTAYLRLVMPAGESASMAGIKGEGANVIGLSRANRRAARIWSHATDRLQRGMIFFDVAAREGFFGPDAVSKLLTDPKLRETRNRIANEANEAGVAFNRKIGTGEKARYVTVAGRKIRLAGGKDLDRLMRTLIVFWPWMRGSAYWGARFVREHPVQAGVQTQLGVQGAEQIEEDLGRVPSFMWGAFKTGERNIEGIGRVNEVRQFNSLNPFTTWPEFAGVLAAAGQPEAAIPRALRLTEYLTPAAELGLQYFSRRDPFTGETLEDLPLFANLDRDSLLRRQLGDSFAVWNVIERYMKAPDTEGKLYPVTEGLGSGEFWQQIGLGPGGERPVNPEEQAQFALDEAERALSPMQRGFLDEFHERNAAVEVLNRLGHLSPKDTELFVEGGKLKPIVREAFRRKTQLTEWMRARELDEDKLPEEQLARKLRVMLEFADAKGIEVPDYTREDILQADETDARGLRRNQLEEAIQDMNALIYGDVLGKLGPYLERLLEEERLQKERSGG